MVATEAVIRPWARWQRSSGVPIDRQCLLSWAWRIPGRVMSGVPGIWAKAMNRSRATSYRAAWLYPRGFPCQGCRKGTPLRRQFDTLRHNLAAGAGEVDRYAAMAYDMVLSRRVEQAFALDKEPDRIRDAYGRTSIGEKGLLARRLVEAGTTYVVVSGRWGYFDHHGDNVPPWGGIQRGLTPILPTVDRVIHALISDLDTRGATRFNPGGDARRIRPDASHDRRWRPGPLDAGHVHAHGERRLTAWAGHWQHGPPRRRNQGTPGQTNRPGGNSFPAFGHSSGCPVGQSAGLADPNHYRDWQANCRVDLISHAGP